MRILIWDDRIKNFVHVDHTSDVCRGLTFNRFTVRSIIEQDIYLIAPKSFNVIGLLDQIAAHPAVASRDGDEQEYHSYDGPVINLDTV